MTTQVGQTVPRPGSLRTGSRERARRVASRSAPARFLTLCAVLVSPPLLASATEPNAPSYAFDVQPLLARNCIACHSAGTKMGGLVLETFDGLQQGGSRGPSVVPGSRAESPLYLMVAGELEPRMPFSSDPLGPAEIELLGRWIEAGAPGPGPGEVPAGPEPGRLPKIEPSVAVKPQIFSLAYHPAGRLLAAGRHGGVAFVEPGDGRTVAVLDGLADIARAVAFSPDGRLLAAGGGYTQRGGEVKIWKVEDQRQLLTLEGHRDTVQALAFSPDGGTLATASYDNDIKLWDIPSGRELRTLRDHIDAVYALAFTPDGRRLVSGSADRSVKIWDPATGERLYTLGGPTDGINSIAVHPSGARVAAAGYDRTIRVWELGEDGGKLAGVLIAHRSPILRIAYSPDGGKIVTASSDRTIKVFDAASLDELAILDGQSDWVMSLAFSPDGSRLAAGRFDGSLSTYGSDHFRVQSTATDTARQSP